MLEQRRYHLHRYRQVADTLARHGLGIVVDAVGLKWLVPFQRGWLGHARRPEPYTPAEHLRMALEELGTTAIKLGQILSTRADLLPSDYRQELAKLQDKAPPVPRDEIEAVIVRELGAPASEIFAWFDDEPLAAASIGQVHAATLEGGYDVVVKVRRPGVVEQVETDLEILRNLAHRAERNWRPATEYDLVGLVDEFASTLRAELDYIREGRNAERFATNFAGRPGIHIPAIYWELTTTQVITMERLRGIKVSDLEALDRARIDRRALARRAAGLLLKMVFEDGFFHADPHPGNFFIESDGTIGLIDFGMVGTIDESTRRVLVTGLTAVTNRDAELLVDTLLDLGVSAHYVDRSALRRDLQRLLERYYDAPLSELEISAVVSDALAIMREHRLQLPANLALLTKTTIMAEGLGVMLDPSFRLGRVLEPHARHFLVQQYSPANWVRLWARAGLDAAELGGELPRRMRRILTDLEHGRTQVEVRSESFDPALDRIERLVNRLILGILASALISSMGLLLAVYQPPGWDRADGVIFAIGNLAIIAIVLYLAWSVLRSRRR